jgi:hypothetical protein
MPAKKQSSSINLEAVKSLVEYMRSQNVDSFEVTADAVKVTFGMSAPSAGEVVTVTLTPEQREEELARIKDRLQQVAASADEDLYYSAP